MQPGGAAARKITDKFAACVLNLGRKRALRVLALPSGSIEQNNAMFKLVKPGCLESDELRFNAPLFRGGFYTALVRADFGAERAAFGTGRHDALRLFPRTTGPDAYTACLSAADRGHVDARGHMALLRGSQDNRGGFTRDLAT